MSMKIRLLLFTRVNTNCLFETAYDALGGFQFQAMTSCIKAAG
jgi:hypothetical protein